MVHRGSMVCTLTTSRLRCQGSTGLHMGPSVDRPNMSEEALCFGSKKEYVDIVTDTLHASSSNLLTWNTLVMMKLNWIDSIPREWIEIAFTVTRGVEGKGWETTLPPRQSKRLCQSDTRCSIQGWRSSQCTLTKHCRQ